MPFIVVDLSIQNGDFHSYGSLPEGITQVVTLKQAN